MIEKIVQQAYLETLKHFMSFGRAPHYTELAKILGLSPNEAKGVQHAAADAGVGCQFLENTDYVEFWAPFSNIPTHHLITIDGEQKWYGQCGLEVLSITAIFPGKNIEINSRCLDCGELVHFMLKDDVVVEAAPSTIVAHTNDPFTNWSSSASFY